MEFLRGVCIYKGVIEPKELPEAPCESFGSIDGRSSGPGSLTQKQVLVRIYLAKLPDPMDFGNINLHSRVGGWTNPVEKYAKRQIGSFPQIGAKKKIFETTTQLWYVANLGFIWSIQGPISMPICWNGGPGWFGRCASRKALHPAVNQVVSCVVAILVLAQAESVWESRWRRENPQQLVLAEAAIVWIGGP